MGHSLVPGALMFYGGYTHVGDNEKTNKSQKTKKKQINRARMTRATHCRRIHIARTSKRRGRGNMGQ